jgi:hypothetical protein
MVFGYFLIKIENFQVIFSEILSAKTPEVSVPVIEPTPSLEIRRIEVNLTVENVESNSAYLSWRFFSLEEKQFLDGVQIRYFIPLLFFMGHKSGHIRVAYCGMSRFSVKLCRLAY